MADLIWVQPDTQMDQDGVPEKKILKKLIFKKKSADNKESMEILPGGKELIHTFFFR